MFPKFFACCAAGEVILDYLHKCYKLASLKKRNGKMTREELIDKVNGILSEEFETDVTEMKPDAPMLEVLDLDSLDMVDVVVLVEKNFDYVMKKEDFAKIKTFSDFYDFLQGKI